MGCLIVEGGWDHWGGGRFFLHQDYGVWVDMSWVLCLGLGVLGLE